MPAPTSDIHTGGWTATPTGAVFATVDESSASDADFVTSPGLADGFVVGLATALASGSQTVQVRADSSTAGVSMRVVMLSAADAPVGTSAWQALTTTPTTYAMAVTLSASSDRMRVEVAKTALLNSLPLHTPLLFEGDSNTDEGYSVNGWAKRVRTLSGQRFYVPPGGNYAAAGSTTSGTTGSGSPISRLSTTVAAITAQVARTGKCVMWCQIGTNGEGSGNTALQSLTQMCEAWKNAGAFVIMTNCPPNYGGGSDINAGYRAQFLTALRTLQAAGTVDVVLDLEADAGYTIADSGDGTHHSESGHQKIAVAGIAKLIPYLSSNSISSDAGASVVTGTFEGAAGAASTQTSGVIASGWTGSVNIGDGTAVLSKPTANKQRIVLSGGTTGAYFVLTRTDARTVQAGETYDSYATFEIVASSAQSLTALYLVSSYGSFPANTVLDIDRTNWAGPSVFRTYNAATASAGASSITHTIVAAVAAGQSATVDVSDMRCVLRIPAPATAPANTVAPVVSGSSTVGGTAAVSTGTWTGSPAPTYAYQWQLNGANISGQTASSITVPNNAGAALRCVVTATNSAGSASANSNAVTIQAAASSVGWDSSVTSTQAATITYSNAGKTATITAGYNNYLAVRTANSKTTGKYYVEIISSDIEGYGLASTPGGANDLLVVNYPGIFYYEGGSSGGVAFGASARVCMAIDLDTKNLWVRTEAGNWNNSGTANPVTGVGGKPINATAACRPAAVLRQVSDAATLCAGSADWVHPPPSGFGEWTA